MGPKTLTLLLLVGSLAGCASSPTYPDGYLVDRNHLEGEMAISSTNEASGPPYYASLVPASTLAFSPLVGTNPEETWQQLITHPAIDGEGRTYPKGMTLMAARYGSVSDAKAAADHYLAALQGTKCDFYKPGTFAFRGDDVLVVGFDGGDMPYPLSLMRSSVAGMHPDLTFVAQGCYLRPTFGT
ncbi:MAG: hypothetical protein V4510_11955 [bacterium]